MPVRIQRRRTRGWRMPEGAVYVGRPSRWGNCFTVDDRRVLWRGVELWWGFASHERAVEHAVRAFEWQVLNKPLVVGFTLAELRAQLGGRDLACWCRLTAPCHADVLLRLANPTTEQEAC